jgi:hypothetical protein
MTLLQFVSTLSDNNIELTVKDGDTYIIVFLNTGYTALKTELLSREVEFWAIDRSTAVSVVLKAVVDD